MLGVYQGSLMCIILSEPISYRYPPPFLTRSVRMQVVKSSWSTDESIWLSRGPLWDEVDVSQDRRECGDVALALLQEARCEAIAERLRCHYPPDRCPSPSAQLVRPRNAQPSSEALGRGLCVARGTNPSTHH